MHKNSKIFVAGHKGMLGSAIVRMLIKCGFDNLLLQTRTQLDLSESSAVSLFFKENKPDVVIIAAAKVGVIQANVDHPADFLLLNMQIQNNLIHHAHLNDVTRVCFIGSSCMYPKDCKQPMCESHLMSGPLEPTNEGYALAKITGLKLMSSYRAQYNLEGFSVVPCNLYGTNDSFDPNHSHVLSSLVKKFVDALDNKTNQVSLWGSGVARREFMHVDDAAAAILHFLNLKADMDVINIGWGIDISIKDLAEAISCQVGFQGTIAWDRDKPDGMLRKCMDVTRMSTLGFQPSISLAEGIKKTIIEYQQIKGTHKS